MTEKPKGIEKLGEINGVGVYYDQYQEDNKFLIGYKGGGKVNFILVNTRDLKIYEITINHYNEEKCFERDERL